MKEDLQLDTVVAKFATTKSEGHRSVACELKYLKLDTITSTSDRPNNINDTQIRMKNLMLNIAILDD